MSDDGFYALGISCTHCGGELSAKYDTKAPGIRMQGLHPLIYRHTKTGIVECTTTHEARPYDGWSATRAYDIASRENGHG